MPCAFFSVTNKIGIALYCQELVNRGWEILSAGGTAKCIAEAGVPVTNLSDKIGQPILGHRVVTLSREIFAAILATDSNEDAAELKRIGMPRIDLVCVDLYDLNEALEAFKNGKLSAENVNEKIDIGGPSLLRAAAKARRIVIPKSHHREEVLKWLDDDKPESEKFLNHLAFWAEDTAREHCQLASEFYASLHVCQ